MAFFLKNRCIYCGQEFDFLNDLIIHTEHEHLDFDPRTISQLEEEKPACLPMSYVLKFSNPDEPVPSCSGTNETVINESNMTSPNINLNDCDLRQVLERNIPKFEVKDNTSRYLGTQLFSVDSNHKKPFVCNMPRCLKRYKNVNGIRYHYKNHHKIHMPLIKKSLLKHKTERSSSKKGRFDPQGIPFYTSKSQAYRNMVTVTHCEDYEELANEYFNKILPTSTIVSNQVPLSNTTRDLDLLDPLVLSNTGFSNQVPLPSISFNYYNITDDNSYCEDFSEESRTNCFVAYFDK